MAENKRLILELDALQEENAKQKREMANIRRNQDENSTILRKLDALEFGNPLV
jgi:hypothetical protein